jgi:2-polyprenyl-3-methyl-5-hydroxy-6-metoxy-1,4-benzoquinol methylase
MTAAPAQVRDPGGRPVDAPPGPADVPGRAAVAVYERALARAASGRSAALTMVDGTGRASRVDALGWCRPRLPGDAGLLLRCDGPTLDVGCGPGRLTAALHHAGVPALGIDVSRVAVRLARRRGAPALRRDVFAAVPGRWRHILLADGNIGIGGDPARLLRRCAALLGPGGRVHAEIGAPASRTWSGAATLHAAGAAAAFRWAEVAAHDLPAVAARGGLRVRNTWTEEGRWFATLGAA